MENYTLNTESKDIVGGINEINDIYKPAIESVDAEFWESPYEVPPTMLTQEQYNAIKERIENGLPVIIRVNHGGYYTSTITAISTSIAVTPGTYSFVYINYDADTHQYFFKCFEMKSDLTCSIYTKII